LARFASCGLTVQRFCARERVSVASFYAWRKRLKVSGGAVRGEGFLRPAFQSIEVVPARNTSTPAVSLHLRNGTRIDVPALELDAIRAVLSEVLHVGAEGSDRPC